MLKNSNLSATSADVGEGRLCNVDLEVALRSEAATLRHISEDHTECGEMDPRDAWELFPCGWKELTRALSILVGVDSAATRPPDSSALDASASLHCSDDERSAASDSWSVRREYVSTLDGEDQRNADVADALNASSFRTTDYLGAPSHLSSSLHATRSNPSLFSLTLCVWYLVRLMTTVFRDGLVSSSPFDSELLRRFP
uniref:Uncharacterized protein n=1 Tax=Physcomitrium patens TaxID=3218 RepID=A0A7I4CR95_PHYPA